MLVEYVRVFCVIKRKNYVDSKQCHLYLSQGAKAQKLCIILSFGAQLVTQNCFILSHRFHLTDPADNNKCVQPNKRTHGYHLKLHSTCTYVFVRQRETIIEIREEWKVDRQYEAILTIQTAHLVLGQSSGPHNNQFTRRNAQKRINSTRVFFRSISG